MSEEAARVKVVRSAAEKEASGLPALLRKAVSTEARAAKLKRAAKARMAARRRALAATLVPRWAEQFFCYVPAVKYKIGSL